MRIDRRLNLVQPVATDAGTLYLHSVPISRVVWENYYLMLSKTYAALMSEGLNIIAGPPIAKMMLREIAITSKRWDGPDGVEKGLLAEIRRLTNVLVPTDAGWQTLPFDEVLRRDLIDEDALADAEGAMVFFTCVSAVLRGPTSKEKLTILIGGIESVWGVQTTPLDVTAFGSSLPTSMSAATSAPTPKPSSAPY